MTKILVTIALVLSLFVGSAVAQEQPVPEVDYGFCTKAINAASEHLIAPVAMVKDATKLSEDIFALLIAPATDDADIHLDSVVTVHKHEVVGAYEALAKPFDGRTAWIAVVEGKDRGGDLALRMNIWVNTSDGCVRDGVGERVDFQSYNSPTVFWEAVKAWEKDHPDNVLVRRSTVDK